MKEHEGPQVSIPRFSTGVYVDLSMDQNHGYLYATYFVLVT
jgi:hypothetical protein